MIQNSYFDKVFHLKDPKLIINFKINNFDTKNLFHTDTQNHTISNLDIIKSDLSLSAKFDRKNKNNTQNQISLDIKENKNKSKYIKKYKKQEFLDKEDLFSSSSSLIKSYKFNKNKRKDKKTYSNNFIISDLPSTSNEEKNIIINHVLTIQELSVKLNVSEAKIITDLFLQGISLTINDLIDIEVAQKIAKHYNFNILNSSINNSVNNIVKSNRLQSNENNTNYIKRAPIITILGHVDHGKTTLLDSILNTKFASKELGGITQSINGYEIEWLYQHNLYKLVFLDTPGHEAFVSMRLRGARITDIILLVVAANDGLKPQTIEVIKYILDMKIPYIVAINKIDKQDINITKIKKDFMQYNIISKEFGGNAIFVELSALKNLNIDLLLSNICLLSDSQNLVFNPYEFAQGHILESFLDKRQGLITNIIVQNGTLRIGDWIVAGDIYGKVKSIINVKNIKVQTALPSSFVKILGFSNAPKSGISFQVVSNEKKAKDYINNILDKNNSLLSSNLNQLNSKIIFNQNNISKKLNLIIKTDTQGSLEAIMNSLSKISQKKVQLNIISAKSGNISNTDLDLALTTNSLIIAFRMNTYGFVNQLVKQNNLLLKVFDVIYDLLDCIENHMLDLIDNEYDHVLIGRAIVQEIFSINKSFVAGCLVTEGKLKKTSYICVYRNKEIVYQGSLISLKHLKEDVDEVFTNKECGIMCNYNEWSKKDIVDAYELNLKEKSL